MLKDRHPLGHFIGKEPLHWKQVGYFTGKRCFTGNGFPAYSKHHRRTQLHWKWHSYLQLASLNVCVDGRNKQF